MLLGDQGNQAKHNVFVAQAIGDYAKSAKRGTFGTHVIKYPAKRGILTFHHHSRPQKFVKKRPGMGSTNLYFVSVSYWKYRLIVKKLCCVYLKLNRSRYFNQTNKLSWVIYYRHTFIRFNHFIRFQILSEKRAAQKIVAHFYGHMHTDAIRW